MAILLITALPCAAEVAIATSLATRYEDNSNLYALQTGNLPIGVSQRGDTFFNNSAMLRMKYQWGRQQLLANATGVEFKYGHFTDLDHNEYSLGGGFNWKLGQSLDGVLDASRSRRMVSFADINLLQQLSIQAERLEGASIGIKLGNDWRLEIAGKRRRVDENLPGVADQQLRDNAALATLLFSGRTGLTAGLRASYVKGDYSRSNSTVPVNRDYRQSDAGFVLNYKTSRAVFNGNVGYTNRTSTAGVDSLAGVTGEMTYVHQLTGKTSVDLTATRIVSSYIAGTGSQLDNIAGFNLHWQTTNKVGLVIGYNWTDRRLPLQGNAPIGSDRIDRIQYTSFRVDYVPLRWLVIVPYANVQTRRSNFVGASFNASVIGVQLTTRWESASFR